MPSLLPEYEGPVVDLFMKAVRSMLPAHAPLLAEMRPAMVDHLPQASVPYAAAAGGVMGGVTIAASLTTSTSELAGSSLDAWYWMLWSAAEQMAEQQMRHLLQGVERATAITGNQVNLHGAPISHDFIMDMLERMDFKVGEDGLPMNLAMVVAPGVAQKIQDLPPRTVEQEIRFQRIMNEKRREQDAKKRIRRLGRRAE